MKKVIILIFGILLASVTSAQDKAIKINLSEGFRPYNLLAYEFRVKEKSSVSLGLGYGYFRENRNNRYSSYGVGAQYRYYFSKSLKGWYVSGDTGYLRGEVTVRRFRWGLFGSGELQPIKSNFSAITLAAKAGRQWIFDKAPIKGLIIDLNLGIANTHINFESSASTIKNLRNNRFNPILGIGFGYTF